MIIIAQMKDKTLQLILGFVIVVGLVWWGSSSGFFEAAIAPGTDDGAGPDLDAAITCPAAKTGSLKLRYINGQNTTNADYQATDYRVFQDSVETQSGTTTPGTGAYASETVDCPSSGIIYYLYTASNGNSFTTSFSLKDAGEEVDVRGATPSEIELRLLDSLNNNITAGDSDSFIQDEYTSSNKSITAGDTLSYTLGLRPKDTFAATGSTNIGQDGILVCTNADRGYFDLVTLKSTGLDPAPTSITVPSGISGSETLCWTIPAVTSSESFRSLEISLHASVDPGYSQSPRFKIYDYQLYVGTDGTIKVGIVNDANANVGVTDRYVQGGIV